MNNILTSFTLIISFALTLSGQDDQLTFLDVFDVNSLNKVEIKFGDWDWRHSVYETNELVEAKVSINGGTEIPIKIGRKGNSSNFNTMGRDKIPFKIDGPRSFNFKLNNNYRDYSMGAREYIAYKMHREFTGIGCHIAPSEVYIDNEFYGIYLAIEDLNRKFYDDNIGGVVTRVKANPTNTEKFDGTLFSNLFWMGEEPSYYEGRYEVKRGAMSDLIDIIDVINNSPEEAHKHIDIDQVCKFLAVENYLINTGGIIGEVYSHNYEFVKRKNDGKWQLIPWDLNLCLGAWSKSSLSDEETPIELLTQLPPTFGGGNNGLIALIVNDYFFLYHYYYNQLLEKIDGKLLVSWAKEYLEIIKKSTETDDKLYDENFVDKAYTENLTSIDGFVTALIPTLEKRYAYLKGLEMDKKFSNKIRQVKQVENTVYIIVESDITDESVMIEYLNNNNNLKKLRAHQSKEKGFYKCVLPQDAVSYYAYTYYKGIKYSLPVRGILDLKIMNLNEGN